MATIENHSEVRPSAQIFSSLKKTVACTYSSSNFWSMLPGIIAATVCLVGVVALNILRHQYFSILFVAGTVCSTYNIYQGYRARLLKTFQENNERYEKSNIELKKTIIVYQEQLQKTESLLIDFRTQNEKLQKSLALLKAENTDLKSTVDSLKFESEKLRHETGELKQINESFEKNAQQQILQLDFLMSSLKSLEEAVFVDHTIFGEKVALFRETVNSFTQIPTEINASLVNFNYTFGKQVEKVTECAREMEKFFLQIEMWKNPNAISIQISLLQELNKSTRDLSERTSELTQEIAYNSGRASILKQEIAALEILEQQFSELIEKLKTEVDRLGGVVVDNRKTIEEMTQIVNELKSLQPESFVIT